MSHEKSMKIIEKAYADHARNLVKWALRRLKSPEDAEDFCSEVMSQFTKTVIIKEAENEVIADIDAYLWTVAHNLMRKYHRNNDLKDKLVEDLEKEIVGTPFMASETDFATDAINGVPTADTDKLLQKLRLSISQLDFNHRSAMVMHHLEMKSLSEISKKLNVTESYVKKLLYESRQKIQQDNKKNLYNVDKLYLPQRVKMCTSGEYQESYDHRPIEESLSKQNICLACYERACSVEELSRQLGLPSAYIEFDLDWLVKSTLVKKQKNRYSTMFFIFDGTFFTRLTNVFYRHKTQCLDKIVERLTALDDKVKAIGFTGSDRPINQLLWLMIYKFTDIGVLQAFYDEFGHRFDWMNKLTGKRYFSFGIFSIESTIPTDLHFLEKYLELKKFECNGSYTFNDTDKAYHEQISWIMYRKNKDYIHTPLSLTSPTMDFFDQRILLYKVLSPDFCMDSLDDDERYLLTQCIDMGILSLSKDGRSVIPHIYVFTGEQRKCFEKLLLECYQEVKSEMNTLYKDLYKMCKECLPKQLEGFWDYVSYWSLLFTHFYAAGFAYYDGGLYIPEGDTGDYTMLTLNVTVGGGELGVRN